MTSLLGKLTITKKCTTKLEDFRLVSHARKHTWKVKFIHFSSLKLRFPDKASEYLLKKMLVYKIYKSKEMGHTGKGFVAYITMHT